MITKIALINRSTSITNSDLSIIASACATQISRDFGPVWGKNNVPVEATTSDTNLSTNVGRIYIFDNADQAGSLGYHTESINGIVFGRVFARTILNYGLPVLFNQATPNSITVSSVVSHEILELLGNPFVSLWCDGPNNNGYSEYAYEMCDAVEANVYAINTTVVRNRSNVVVKVAVSNFVYPKYFDTASPVGSKLDHLGLLSGPFSMTSGGYMIIRNDSGDINEVFGANYPDVLREMREKE